MPKSKRSKLGILDPGYSEEPVFSYTSSSLSNKGRKENERTQVGDDGTCSLISLFQKSSPHEVDIGQRKRRQMEILLVI